MNTLIHITMSDMAFKRIDITLHPEDLEKLDRLCKKLNFKRSTMISRLIQEYNENKDKVK